MPFSSPQQEMFMMINHHSLWRKWVRKYGHVAGFKAYLRKVNRKKKKRKYVKKKKKKKG